MTKSSKVLQLLRRQTLHKFYFLMKKIKALKQLRTIKLFHDKFPYNKEKKTLALLVVFIALGIGNFLFLKKKAITENFKATILLIKNNIENNNTEEAERLLEKLQNTKNHPIPQQELLKLKFAIFEKKYAAAAPNKRIKIKNQFKNNLKYLLASNFNPETIKEIYDEALKLNFTDIAYLAADKLANIKKASIKWHQKAFNLAITLNNFDEAFKHLNFLISHSTGNKKINLLREALNLSVTAGDYDKGYFYGEQLLATKRFRKKDVNILINMALSIRDYNSAFEYAHKAFKITRKKYYLKKAIQIALWTGKKELVKHIITTYGLHYLNDPDIALFLLKTSMALNDRNFSQQLADKVVKAYGGKR